jgi:hypothetical protein
VGVAPIGGRLGLGEIEIGSVGLGSGSLGMVGVGSGGSDAVGRDGFASVGVGSGGSETVGSGVSKATASGARPLAATGKAPMATMLAPPAPITRSHSPRTVLRLFLGAGVCKLDSRKVETCCLPKTLGPSWHGLAV